MLILYQIKELRRIQFIQVTDGPVTLSRERHDGHVYVRYIGEPDVIFARSLNAYRQAVGLADKKG